MGSVGRQRPRVHGPAAAKRPANKRKIAASGQAVGNQTRMRLACLDHAGSNLDQPQSQRHELRRSPSGMLGRGGAHCVQQPISGGMENEPELIGAWAAARGPVRGELGLVQLDEVLGLAARAVDRLVEMPGRAFERCDDIARIEALGSGFETGHDATRLGPAFGGVAELGPSSEFLFAGSARRTQRSSATTRL